MAHARERTKGPYPVRPPIRTATSVAAICCSLAGVPSVLAVVSKKVFEADARVAGKKLGLGEVWPTAKYLSTHASLRPLGEGGHLFLATVRPPDEALWLVAVLVSPALDDTGWAAAPNTVPITDITPLKTKIKFASGTGITAEKGKLGMSLQTPRTLTAEDEALLLQAAALDPKLAAPAAPSPKGPRVIHVNAHEPGSKAPCLCKKCLPTAPAEVTIEGVTFQRDATTASDRVLHYWFPASLAAEREAMQRSIGQRLADKMRPLGPPRLDPAAFVAKLLAKKLLVLESKKSAPNVAKRIAPFLRWKRHNRASVVLEILGETEGVEEVVASEEDLDAIFDAHEANP